MTSLEAWLAERAREELEMLEAQHPTRFNYLKLELKSLICCVAVDVDSSDHPPTSAALTQASSNRKRKSEWGTEPKRLEQHRKKTAPRKSSASGGSEGGESGNGSSKKSDSSVDAALRRAEACLQRIRQVKQSLFS